MEGASSSKSFENQTRQTEKRKHSEEQILISQDANIFVIQIGDESSHKSLLYTADFCDLQKLEDDPLDPLDLISYSPETSDNEITQTMERKTNVWKETFLQNENCFATCESLPQCYECFKNPMMNKYSCRFYQFRKIDRCSGRFTVVGFLDPFMDPNAHDLALWINPENHLKVDQETADYILSLIASQFCEISEAELKISQKHKNDHKQIAWKRSVLQVREICDVCDTSVFNIHWTCSHCGTCVCIDCFNERRDGISRWKPKTKSDKEERDMHFWLKCQRREGHDMKLVQMTCGDTLKSLNATLHTVCDQRNITQKCGCSLRTKNCFKMQTKSIMLELNKSDSEFRQIMKNQRHKDKKIVRRRYSLMEQARIYKTVTLTFISKNRILKILEPTESPDCYKAFQSEWEQGKPVVVSNVTRNMRMEIWSPEYFSGRFGNEKHVMINCVNGVSINRVATKFFWDGFAAIENRIPTQNAQSDKIVLKLKDWPTSDDFANVMKEHFEDVMGAVPLAAYTRRDGKFNLARYLPEHFSRPDLGPKMYSAYSQTHPSKQGSTNLHLDVSDAINIMLHVSKPSDAHLAPKQYGYEAILLALEAAGVDENDKTYFKKETHLPGAIWHIFPAHQADGIRKLLQTVAKENGKPLGANDDPIHDQDWYIDEKLRKRLAENGVEGYSIVQYQGDAVFIPAGAPHQVLNILDCIKVALDFVAPENLSECLNLTEEFRVLSTRHANHEDKLQIKNILFHTIKNLVPAATDL